MPRMHRKHSSNGRRSRIHGRNSGGVHRQVQKSFQSESFRSVSENNGEMIWQQTKRKIRNKQGKGHLTMNTPPIVSQQGWEAARQELLVKEKAFTRSRDALAAERRRMPWLAVDKKYEFDGPKGKVRLARFVRGTPSVDRLSRFLRARSVRLARARLSRLLPGRRSGWHTWPT